MEGGAGGGVDGGFCQGMGGREAGGGGGGVEGGAGGGEERVEVLDYAVVDCAAGEAEEVCGGEGLLDLGRERGETWEGRGSTAESALVEAELGSQVRVRGWFGHGLRIGGGGGVWCFGGGPEEARHFEVR